MVAPGRCVPVWPSRKAHHYCSAALFLKLFLKVNTLTLSVCSESQKNNYSASKCIIHSASDVRYNLTKDLHVLFQLLYAFSDVTDDVDNGKSNNKKQNKTHIHNHSHINIFSNLCPKYLLLIVYLFFAVKFNCFLV